MPFLRKAMFGHFVRLTTIAIALMLAACAGPGIRPGSDDREHWQLSGKIGLRGPQLAESAYLNWRQCGDTFDIRISGPLGQTVAKIDGHGAQLRLWFEGREPVSTSDPEALMDAITRALQCYKNQKQWRQLQTNGMRQDYSWTQSAQQYEQLYQTAVLP